MSRIDLNIVATGNFSQVETQLARLKAQAAALGSTVSSMSVFGPRATADMQSATRLFDDSLRSSGMFQTQMVNLRSETERFGTSLQRGNVKLGDSFRIAGGHIRNQQTAISKLAREQVRMMNSTTVAMGDGRQMVVTPRGIDEAINKQKILNQEYRIFRQVVSNGSTQLINWGKNTQWAGRQLTVGLTVPLTIFGAAAAKMFMDADKQLTRLAKVYGDASKGMVDTGELDRIRSKTLGLAKEIASTMGVAVDQTIAIAADLAATGKEGNELLESTAETMRLAVLGEVDRQEAMRATLSIQNVFNKDTKELAETINFLNAVENQTSTSLDDLTTGIVKAGPVVQGLGGDVEDLALMMVAMREGGIPAAEAANAIKSSLASLINPTQQTTKLLKGFGINLVEIVDKNAGNVTGTLVDLQGELAKLDQLSRQRAIEQIFGKFQFSRINALMSNLGQVGSQTEEVLKISGMSVQQLAATAEKELSTLTESASMKFTRAMEGLKASLIPVGEVFTKVGTMILDVANKILEIFNNLPEPVKNFLNGLMILTALAGPLIMITGVLANFFGYIIKGISSFMALKSAGRGVFEHFTPESIAAQQASELVEKALYDEVKAINILESAIEKLNQTLSRMSGAANVAGSSVKNLAKDTLVGAESTALLSSGSTSLSRYSVPTTSIKGDVAGFERSHLIPKLGRGTVQYGAQVGATLIPTTSAEYALAGTYQRAETKNFKPEFYDPSSGKSRKDILHSSATTPMGKASSLNMNEASAKRLLPSRGEYNASVSEYLGMIEVLNSLPEKQTERLREAIKTGNFQEAEAELDLVIKENKQAIDQAVESNRLFVSSLTGNLEEVTKAAIGREVELTSNGGPLTTRTSGKGPTSFLYARTGGGVGYLEQEGLTEAKAKAIRLGIEAEAKLTESNKKLKTITNKELIERNKNIASMKVTAAVEKDNGRRYALINKKWYAVTGDRIRLLDASKTEERNVIKSLKERRKAELDKAKASKMAAQADLDETKASKMAAQADLDETKASRMAAAGDLAEVGPSAAAAGKGPGLMGRARGIGKGGGMMALGSLSMATMLLPTGEEGSAMGNATNILGGAGMGASMGMMAGPYGALAGAIIGGAIPAVTAFQTAQQEANDALVKYGEAINGSSIVLDGFAKEMGVLKPSEKLAAAIGKIASPEKVMEEGSQILQTDTGQRLLELSKKIGGEELINALRNQLQQLTLLEIFTPDQAKAVAQTIAMELGNPVLGQELVKGINSVLDSEGNILSDQISKMFVGTIGDVKIPEYDAQEFGRKYVESMGIGDALSNSLVEAPGSVEFFSLLRNAFGVEAFTENQLQKGLELYARETVPAVVSQLDKLREAQSMVLSDFMKGAIGYDEYMSSMSNIREQTTLAADALMDLRERGAPVTDLILDIAKAGGREDEFKAIEDRAKDIMDILSLGGENSSRFYTQIQIAAAYGDITEGELSTILQMIQDPSQKAALDVIFNVEGAEDNAVEIIKLLNMGMDADFVKNIAINYVNIGKPLDDVYASLVAISQLPPEIQKEVQTRITGNPLELENFVSDYEYAMSLPDDRKTLKAEIYNNEDLALFKNNWEEFMNLPNEERKTAVFEYLVTGQYSFDPAEISVPQAVSELDLPNISDLMGGDGSGGGGSVDTSAIEEAYDKQIEKQDQIIENIKKEREERQKLYDLEKKAFDFAMKEQDLKNQIAIARAEGRMADAAMLQSQLDNERSSNKESEAERRRQEKEDKRIEAANKRKEALEEDKKRALDAAKGGSGGSGGSGLDEKEQRRIENRLKFLNDELSSVLLNNSKILDDISEKGSTAFWDSEPIKRYIEEAEKLNIPLDTINEQLDNVYDQLVNKGFGDQGIKEFDKLSSSLEKVGIYGDSALKILPNVFGIIRDTSLSEDTAIQLIIDQFIIAGMTSEEAEDRAKRFFKVVGQRRRFQAIDNFEKDFAPIKKLLSKETGEEISAQFADGMRKGLTKRGILSQISSSLVKSIYDDGIAEGLEPTAAAARAELMAVSLLDRIEEKIEIFNDSESSKVNIRGVYDDSALPEWMREARAGGTPFTSDRMEREINLTVSSNSMPGTKNNPSYTNISNWPSNYSYPSSTTRASGGYIAGPGSGTSDSIPTMLSNGEYVIRAASVAKYGLPFLNLVNQGTLLGAARGGLMSRYPSIARGMRSGGYAYQGMASGGLVENGHSEYNINVSVAGTDASADDIANKVMQTLQRRDKMNRAGIRL